MEKALGGVGGDTSGVQTDAFGQMLSSLQDYLWDGMIFPGFPGSGKTELAKAMGTESGGLFIKFDLGATRGSFVGQSERMIRAAMKMLFAMGGNDVFWICTCNSMVNLKPELLRRMGFGIWFFDLPTTDEQEPIWNLKMRKYNIVGQDIPEDRLGWTGAEIDKNCLIADRLGVSLEEAGKRIVPVIRSMGGDVQKLRDSANGKYLSATHPGLYECLQIGPAKLDKRMISNKD